MYEIDSILFAGNDVPKFQLGKSKPINEHLGWNNLGRVLPMMTCREPVNIKELKANYI